MPTERSFALTRATSYSTLLTTAAAGEAQRGMVHSVFKAAANIVFPGGLILSLNACGSPRMPNGIELSTAPGTFPFTVLRPGLPVLFGAQRVVIEAAACSLDLSHCTQWDPYIARPERLDRDIVRKNREWMTSFLSSNSSSVRHHQAWSMQLYSLFADALQESTRHTSFENKIEVLPMAHSLCGRGAGLTPAGDDILAGWMAANWLLYGPLPRLLAAYQDIIDVARQQTHLLSQCWLSYVAEGHVAQPIQVLLEAITSNNESKLTTATQAVLAMGATSGHDLLQGILLGLKGF